MINSRICGKSIIYLKNIKEDIIKMLEIRGTCVNEISRVTGIIRKIIQEVKMEKMIRVSQIGKMGQLGTVPNWDLCICIYIVNIVCWMVLTE